jgi:hypothetical protein
LDILGKAMSREVKVFVALAPVCLVAMVYSLTQGDWWSAGLFAFLEVLMFTLYRVEKRSRSPKVPGTAGKSSDTP